MIHGHGGKYLLGVRRGGFWVRTLPLKTSDSGVVLKPSASAASHVRALCSPISLGTYDPTAVIRNATLACSSDVEGTSARQGATGARAGRSLSLIGQPSIRPARVALRAHRNPFPLIPSSPLIPPRARNPACGSFQRQRRRKKSAPGTLSAGGRPPRRAVPDSSPRAWPRANGPPLWSLLQGVEKR